MRISAGRGPSEDTSDVVLKLIEIDARAVRPWNE
jgi:hypothetical protein